MRAVILNDTRADGHHGCARVMRLLEEGLARHGITVAARSPVRHDWRRDTALTRALGEADLVVINGEGTLHHGTPWGALLLRVTEAVDCPVVLVNALWQENPADWDRWLARLEGVWARDSRSAAALSERLGRDVPWVPDLTLSAPIPGCPGTGILFGDSVRAEDSARLADLARARAAALVPSVTSLKRRKGRGPLRLLRDGQIALLHRAMSRRVPGFALAPDEAAYARAVAGAGLHVTGRFHGVCYAMAARVPFLALASNSWKIEALIADAGLSPDRLVTPGGLEAALARYTGWSADETLALDAFLDRAGTGAEEMFRAIAALAK